MPNSIGQTQGPEPERQRFFVTALNIVDHFFMGLDPGERGLVGSVISVVVGATIVLSMIVGCAGINSITQTVVEGSQPVHVIPTVIVTYGQ